MSAARLHATVRANFLEACRADLDGTLAKLTALQKLLDAYRSAARTEREKGTYFEELILCYFRNEPQYRDLYEEVWTYADWAREQGKNAQDTGIDLVARTRDTNDYHAIQCKLYAEDHRVQKRDIDSFFTASGKRPFKYRIIVASTNNWSANADAALEDQQPDVAKIDLQKLEESQIDWSRYVPQQEPVLRERKSLRPHQEAALDDVTKGLQEANRGKLIMACGTGKTFVSLKIAETTGGPGKRVLFMVPSLALLSQALPEWTQQSETPLSSFAVCSDSDVGKLRKTNEDAVHTLVHELQYPATTNAEKLAGEMHKRHHETQMSVVFSTYHSIQVISDAQREHGLPEFDLVICDEAHRTTGATFAGEDESNFVRVHDNDNVRASKRLYMTATPRIYGDVAQAKAEKDDIALCSMDDEALYGNELHVLTFSEAVQRDLLVDYKVIVLTVDEAHISRSLQAMLSDENNQLRVGDAAKIVGCWKALAKEDQEGELVDDPSPMQRAVAFCQVIERQPTMRTHKVSSKEIAAQFESVVAAYQAEEDTQSKLICKARHIDGSMNASEKGEQLAWLKASAPDNTCLILSNVRCLSEGVDVPALDAVLFLTPRNSQVDVVQSVGRVMRKAPGKKRGYIILPVLIPSDVEPDKALNDDKVYSVVWQVLQALRSHDDKFDAFINKLELVGENPSKMEVIAVTDQVQPKQKSGDTRKSKRKNGQGIGEPGKSRNPDKDDNQYVFQFSVGEVEKALYAKIVKKCGNRLYWEEWATDVAKIAQTHITRISTIVGDENNVREVQEFNRFVAELRSNLNESITREEVIEMLAQHLITRPVFDALFEGYAFAKSNPVSIAMQNILDVLERHHLEKETDTLERFYASVRMRASGIDSAAGRQKIIVELYDKFFRNAFPRTTQRLGIVYTPVEVVDFIIHSVNDILQQEFGQTLGSKDVGILDPFTGTGTFISRLLESKTIKLDELTHKYVNEIEANEIVLLAYYIAAINIESMYHDLVGGDYVPFRGICLTDTFSDYSTDESPDGTNSGLMLQNSLRRKRQNDSRIKVIMGNPPYSAGQKSQNDNANNVRYRQLDLHIRDTYAKHSSAKLLRNLYDSYIRSIRWASDRIGQEGVIGYITNASWIDSNAMDGLRKCIAEEFSDIWVFHLRGNQRTSGETSRREGGKIFGSGSRAPVAITILVKNPRVQHRGEIHYYDIGDYLNREEKLDIVSKFRSLNGIRSGSNWQRITPDCNYDWLNQIDPSFNRFLPLGSKRDKSTGTIFTNYSLGVVTNRDAWCYNPSRLILEKNVLSTIHHYNSEVGRYAEFTANGATCSIDSFVDTDATKISWTDNLKSALNKKEHLSIDQGQFVVATYRPFNRQWMYFSRKLNERTSQMPRIFPSPRAANRLICVAGIGASTGFSALMVDSVPNLDMLSKGQCFPLNLFSYSGDLFTSRNLSTDFQAVDGISDEALSQFRRRFPAKTLSKEDIFYYIYGLLYSTDYRAQYKNNLAKQLPRIPIPSAFQHFRDFFIAGQQLAELHLNYESVDLYPVTINGAIGLPSGISETTLYRVIKMRFGRNGVHKDKTKIIYNDHITISAIPLRTYEYVVNGKSALEWVMDRQVVKIDKVSGIVSDANLYATETVGNAAYPLELLQRIISVSLQTLDIVDNLPKLEVDD